MNRLTQVISQADELLRKYQELLQAISNECCKRIYQIGDDKYFQDKVKALQEDISKAVPEGTKNTISRRIINVTNNNIRESVKITFKKYYEIMYYELQEKIKFQIIVVKSLKQFARRLENAGAEREELIRTLEEELKNCETQYLFYKRDIRQE